MNVIPLGSRTVYQVGVPTHRRICHRHPFLRKALLPVLRGHPTLERGEEQISRYPPQHAPEEKHSEVAVVFQPIYDDFEDAIYYARPLPSELVHKRPKEGSEDGPAKESR